MCMDNEQQLLSVTARVRRYRRMRKLTQAELAELVDISHSYMSKLEWGKATPSLIVLCNLADALRI
jgi:transcriptional regulator with XRE-family HTH domain